MNQRTNKFLLIIGILWLITFPFIWHLLKNYSHLIPGLSAFIFIFIFIFNPLSVIASNFVWLPFLMPGFILIILALGNWKSNEPGSLDKVKKLNDNSNEFKKTTKIIAILTIIISILSIVSMIFLSIFYLINSSRAENVGDVAILLLLFIFIIPSIFIFLPFSYLLLKRKNYARIILGIAFIFSTSFWMQIILHLIRGVIYETSQKIIFTVTIVIFVSLLFLAFSVFSVYNLFFIQKKL
jgi:hypothetical protein